MLVTIKGTPVELPDQDAQALVRAGYAHEIETAVMDSGDSGRVAPKKTAAKKAAKKSN